MFVLPKNYQPSKRIAPGETLEVIAEIKLAEDGSYAIEMLDGQKLEPEAREPEAEFDRMVRVPSEGLEV